MIFRWFRHRAQERFEAAYNADLDARLEARRIARERRSEAARKGHSNELRRRAAKCRETFA